MSTPRTNYSVPVTCRLVRQGAFASEPFVLADVGVSGGIAEHWRRFEPNFSAFGFDPLVRECERLNREERNAKVRYFDRFVGFDRYRGLLPEQLASDPERGWSNQPFARTSAARAQQAQAAPFQQLYNSDNPDLVYTRERTSLDAFFVEFPEVRVDFIKIDTDGHDYEVLCGAQRLLDEHQVLGLLVETQFHGVTHLHSNLFSNIDRLLREHGFSLFDLEIYRYTRGILPGHFLYSLAAQTREGQVLAGDALYLRDLPAPGYERRWNNPLPESKLLKLVCLFELFGLPDCAAELLVMERSKLNGRVAVQELLDMLVAQVHPELSSFDEVNRRFDLSLNWFYPRSVNERARRLLPRPLKRRLSALWRRLQRYAKTHCQ